ncbi:folylpolyglutamate synthase/dihydrofolate synthase family protein [Novosphingobium sp.]|uniref:bifunctional folylpolyglutamate synthase/dihydrofolate synthase n=1 Tax=Novosphingobium sp. TaxID=1874826 RepID=UPI00286E8691|nr:folylpolyglutamate synthase/dihydrofolate synthase family protein [Novosphingobium sp.]
MKDFATSDSAAVQAQLDRLAALTVPDGRLGLETMRTLLARLGNPEKRLPPVFHVAGTNGKGSTCAFLRAMLEAQGYRVHATTSPHLVRYNERIRLAGMLISDDRLAQVLEEVLDIGIDLEPSFFEVTIAAAFAEFALVPADACVVEVGMGGRFDATNVLEPAVLAACGIAALGIDHERFLLAPEEGVPADPMARIAFEKAGISKPGVPLITLGGAYPPQAQAAIAEVATSVGAPLFETGSSEWASPLGIPGRHQFQNAGLAFAMLERQDKVAMSEAAMQAGAASARWPARLQRLSAGPLTGTREVWLDGGHNPSAGAALGEHFKGQRLHLIMGMLANKDPASLTGSLAENIFTLSAVPVPAHDYHPATVFGPQAHAFVDVPSALAALPDDGLPVLIAGSLYLAGEVLRLNAELPV